MPNNAILALFYVLSEIYMAFSRPEDLATLVSLHVVPHSIIYPPPPCQKRVCLGLGISFYPRGGGIGPVPTHTYMYVRPAYPSSFLLIQSRLNTGMLDLDIQVRNAVLCEEPEMDGARNVQLLF